MTSDSGSIHSDNAPFVVAEIGGRRPDRMQPIGPTAPEGHQELHIGCTIVIEAVGQPGGYTDTELRRFAEELDSSTPTILSTGDHARYGAVIRLANVQLVGEAFVLGIARFGAAVELAGLPPWPIARVEITSRQATSALRGPYPAT